MGRLRWWIAHERRDRGASAVEYALLAAAVTAAFLLATGGFNAVLAAVFSQVLSGIPATTP